MEDNVGTFLSKPTFEWQPDGTSVMFRFSDARTMREVEVYIQNMRGGIECKPWYPDNNLGGNDPFVGNHILSVTWKDKDGTPLKNGEKAVRFVIAKWNMTKLPDSSAKDVSTSPNNFNS